MSAFWDRIRIDESAGAIFDGERRYIMMRPDVLMGMLRELPATAQAGVLAAMAESARKQGGDSVDAYLRTRGQAHVLQSVIDGAAAFGWGTWRVVQSADEIALEVENSPFAAGHGPAAYPVCAPVNGIFHSLARALMGGDVRVTEARCAAQHGGRCHFIARRAGTGLPPA